MIAFISPSNDVSATGRLVFLAALILAVLLLGIGVGLLLDLGGAA